MWYTWMCNQLVSVLGWCIPILVCRGAKGRANMFVRLLCVVVGATRVPSFFEPTGGDVAAMDRLLYLCSDEAWEGWLTLWPNAPRLEV